MTNLASKTLFIFLFWGAAHFKGAMASEDGRHQMEGLHRGHQSHTEYSGLKDNRVQVRFPERLYRHTLSNMRKHLETLHKINLKLSEGDFAAASILAEKNLGMSSLHDHGAHEVGKYMPSGMAELGTQMHKSASQFAVVAQDAMVTADLASTLKALGKVTESCVACHSSYRLVEK